MLQKKLFNLDRTSYFMVLSDDASTVSFGIPLLREETYGSLKNCMKRFASNEVSFNAFMYSAKAPLTTLGPICEFINLIDKFMEPKTAYTYKQAGSSYLVIEYQHLADLLLKMTECESSSHEVASTLNAKTKEIMKDSKNIDEDYFYEVIEYLFWSKLFPKTSVCNICNINIYASSTDPVPMDVVQLPLG